ncbi:MAG: DEAD/DEAH box helicase [Saprospiraceae bacterium]
MSDLSNIISYFRSCYQVDFKAIGVMNFFGKKVEHQLILNSAELLNGKLLQYPVDSEWGAEMEKTLAIHSQEKALYCCAFFLSGKMNVIGRKQKAFTPLFIYPADLIVESEVYYLSLDVDNVVLNPVFMDFVRAHFDGEITYDVLSEALPKGFLRFDEIHQLENTLTKLIPQLDLTRLKTFPELLSSEELKQISNKRNTDNSSSLLPGIGVGLIHKPSGSRGILNELEELSTKKNYSGVISDIFLKPSLSKNSRKKDKVLTPVTLNQSQMGVLHSASDHAITMVVGPPGTGKSFTTAALAISLINQGKSVLIASKNNQAGNVVADKIEKEFGLKNLVIRTAKRGYLKSLQKRLDDILHGFQAINEPLKIKSLSRSLQTLDKEITQRENVLRSRTKDELKWGEFFYHYQDNFFQSLKKSYIVFRINSRMGHWTITQGLDKLISKRERTTKQLIRAHFDHQLYKVLKSNRAHLSGMLAALKSDTGNLMKEQFEKIDFRYILQALPIWTVNSSDVHQSLPFTKELFDVVIIDEATQCDIASSLPLLQRAKKAVVVGDPKQLRHISFLSQKQQNKFAKKHNIKGVATNKLDYKKVSLLDLVSSSLPSQDQVHFLNEHYRSMPDIIRFSNDKFYNEKLTIMTATPTTLREKNVFLHEVNGIRNTKNQNEQEANGIIDKILQLIKYESDIKRSLCQSIGILSPFRAQVSLLKSKVREKLEARDIARHRILIGTPFHFQGEERDVMLLSFVLDNEAHPSSFIYLNRPDVFNVSITRARSLQHIFSSVSIETLNPDRLFTQYLQEVSKNPLSDSAVSGYHDEDPFLEDVVALLEKWKVDQVYKSYPIAGMEIDIVVIHEDKTFCIDLIGYPGDYAAAFPIDQWNMLSRIGVSSFSLPYSSWHIEPKRAKKALEKFIFGRKGKLKE